ncbi:uncharacterized protein [Typha latifolia]|uniref:uncharacterized protein n=1 Tax=Typha latifolia TaxID=4733 RepID=UPI003C2B3D06
MLLAVEGGGFFSSSASGYRSGLSIILLGQRKEEGHMKVLPWNQYQLTKQEVDPDLRLASRRNRAFRGCASFICFGRVSTGVDGPCPPKGGPIQQSKTLSDLSSASERNDDFKTNGVVNESGRAIPFKSSLKKPSADCSVLACQAADAHNSLREEPNDLSSCTARRKVQWTDICGNELVEIREFELSDEEELNAEYGHDGDKRCGCIIQ